MDMEGKSVMNLLSFGFEDYKILSHLSIFRTTKSDFFLVSQSQNFIKKFLKKN